MSFLAQLRQQQPAPEQGPRLCYLLHISPTTQSARLSLNLAELRQGNMSHPGKAYLIQPQHIQRPPPFMDAGDADVLQALINSSREWLAETSGELPKAETSKFLQNIVGSQRCFVEWQADIWVPVKAGNKKDVIWHWVTNNSGEQILRLRSTDASRLFTAGLNPFCYQMDSHSCTINPGLTSLSEIAVETAMKQNQPLIAQAVNEFLTANRNDWQSLGLPLPKELPIQTANTTVTPALRCSSLATPATGTKARDFVQLEFRYSNENYCEVVKASQDEQPGYWNGKALTLLDRQPDQEQLYRQHLEPFLTQLKPEGATDTNTQWYSSNKKAWQKLLIDRRPKLETLGFTFLIEPEFRHHYVSIDSWQVTIDSKEDFSQLSLQLNADGTTVNLRTLLAQIHQFNEQQRGDDQASLALPDGRLLLIPSEQLTNIMDELGDWLDHSREEFRVPNNQHYRLHDLQQNLPSNTQWQGNVEQLNQAIDLHQTPTLLDKKLSGVNAELRPYQWLGVCWIQHLKHHHVNGLLADDMGLGKTLQTLAHLSLERQQGNLNQPALIVAPTSLLHNWAAEIERFTPHLQYRIVHGQQRHQHWNNLSDYHIIISSYQLIANDINRWQHQNLSWIILDEAQVIKNPNTRASQAVRELNSNYRLCLSGTPVENHLGELWSLLDFLMPGCLGNRTAFKNDYQKPIEQDGNSDRLQQLLQRIAPFMLRRNKDQVARDLPAKTEIYQTISFDEDQEAFYQTIKSEGWAELQQQLPESENKGTQQILLLTALMKLRQACCDPQLLGENDTSSAKREHCIEMICELVAENRAILVFSQFTGMLDLLAQDLTQNNIDYLMLTGKTHNRQQLVDRFQAGETPVFLISLKAGGVGLNLTRADTVIHYDPWWNSAAEQQATDRAHRIGQDKPVFVYKLITENTIEEKIAQLQQRKALLSQHVNQQAQASGTEFALKLEDLLALWEQESVASC